MTGADLIIDAFGRIRGLVHHAADGLDAAQLAVRVDGDANSIGWLLWHLTRIEDDHVAEVAGTEQVWTSAGWAGRFGLPFDVRATGYGQSSDEVAAVRIESAELLTGYHDAVYQRAIDYVKALGDAEFDRVVDESWTPPVTLGVRLISVIGDGLQHAGQASFVRGIITRRG